MSGRIWLLGVVKRENECERLFFLVYFSDKINEHLGP